MTAGMSTLALNPWLYRKLPYDPQKNLAPVSTLVDLPIVLVVSPDSNLHTLADVIAYLKSDKAPSYASLGVGSPHHLAMELFLETVKGKATAIPYRHAAGLAGRGLGCGALDDGRSGRRALIQGGKLRPIAVPAARRSDQLPDVPTFAQAGGPAFEAAAWQGVVAPAGTPEPVIRKLSQAIEQRARPRWSSS